MRLALIPPLAQIGAIQSTDYQLMLPHLMDKENYVNAYLRQRRDGAYIILDNGAAESSGVIDGDELHSLAYDSMVNEIVVPDVLGDMEATIDAALTFGKLEVVDSKLFNYMGVAQGSSFDEVFKCIKFYIDECPWVSTIGIPRHLITTLEEESARMVFAQFVANSRTGHMIHLLGTNPEFIEELRAYGREFNLFNVRGVDTSAPYNYTFAGELLEDLKEVKRPADYFDLKINISAASLVRSNIAVMEQWVRNDTYPS